MKQLIKTEASPDSSHTAEVEIVGTEQVGDDAGVNGSANSLSQGDSYKEQQEHRDSSNLVYNKF